MKREHWIGWTLGLLALASIGTCAMCTKLAEVHHHIEVTNATEQPLEGFRLALDNENFSLDAPTIPPHGRYVFDFVRNRETGYVFSIPDRDTRVELGRCGYTTSGMNAYEVTVSSRAKDGFRCKDVTPPKTGF